MEISEGSIDPLLRRFKKDQLVTSYLKESFEGPPRKYYTLTEQGQLTYQNLLNEWYAFQISINELIKSDRKEVSYESKGIYTSPRKKFTRLTEIGSTRYHLWGRNAFYRNFEVRSQWTEYHQSTRFTYCDGEKHFAWVRYQSGKSFVSLKENLNIGLRIIGIGFKNIILLPLYFAVAMVIFSFYLTSGYWWFRRSLNSLHQR